MQVDSSVAPPLRDQMRIFVPQGAIPASYMRFLSEDPIHSIPLATGPGRSGTGNLDGFRAREILQWLGRGAMQHSLDSHVLRDIVDQYLVWRQLTAGGNSMGLD